VRRSRWLLGAAALVVGVALQLPQLAAPAAGQTTSATSRKFVRALNRHLPALRFDTGEDFFPIKAKAITDNVGNRLERKSGALVAVREAGGRGLTINYLRGTATYPNGDAIIGNDQIDLRGDEPNAARTDATRFQNSPKYGDRAYGRIVYVRENGAIRGAWLQYWFYYYYNDFPRLAIGDHEGDWEMLQVRLDAAAKPLYAVYAQHGTEHKCPWSRIEMRGSRPVAYVALGSHAMYFRSGAQNQDIDNDGEQIRRFRSLIRIGNNTPQFVNWPGDWGQDDNSPNGPKFQGGDKWSNPEKFGTDAGEACE
jgi:hypothetical protein